MALYRVSFKKSAEKDLRKIDRSAVPKIVSTVEALAEEPFPHGSRKLVGSNMTYRVRSGDYRVIYFVSEAAKEIVVQRVRHRREVYR